MIAPIAYSAAIRLPLMMALASVLLVILSIIAPTGGIDAVPFALSTGVFLWLVLACYGKPFKTTLTPAQIEGVMIGIGLWFLYLTSTLLFFMSLPGFVFAVMVQGRRGVIFTAMALGSLLILGACAEMLNFMALGPSADGLLPLVEMRLSDIQGAEQFTVLSLRHMIAAMLFFAVAASTGRLMFTIISTSLVFSGAIMLVRLGADPLAFLVLVSFILAGKAMARPHQERRRGPGFMAGRFALLGLPLVLAFNQATLQVNMVREHYRYSAINEIQIFGFSFADKPVIAGLVLERKIDPALIREGLLLTPADQAVLLADGVRLANKLQYDRGSASLVAAGNFSHLPHMQIVQLIQAEYILTPKIHIDPLTDDARVRHQGMLYANYVRAARGDQYSPIWEIWVKK